MNKKIKNGNKIIFKIKDICNENNKQYIYKREKYKRNNNDFSQLKKLYKMQYTKKILRIIKNANKCIIIKKKKKL